MPARCPQCGLIEGHIPWCAANKELPEGVFEFADGTLGYTCRSCEKMMPLECELDEFDPNVAYCGGSPRCLP